MTSRLILEGIYHQHPGSDHSFALEIDRLEVGSGKIHTLLGPNGSGKSTLLRLAAGILPPNRGHVLYRDARILDMPSREKARLLGYLPQSVSPLFNMKVLDVVLAGRHPWNHGLGLPNQHDLNLACQAMEQMGVEQLSERWFHTLSGGERQRVLVASLLAQQTEIMVLDEPTVGLDLHHQIELFQRLRGAASRGSAILISTHELNLGAAFSDQVTLLNQGRIVSTGSPEQVYQTDLFQSVYGTSLTIQKNASGSLPSVIPAIQSMDVQPESSEETKRDESHTHKPSTDWSPIALFKIFLSLGVFSLLSMLIALIFGSENIHAWDSLKEWWTTPRNVWSPEVYLLDLRMPRIVMAFLAGMALGGTGSAYQSLLRNPLAEPYTLGLAGMASLGAVLTISIPQFAFHWGIWSSTQIGALALALLHTALFLRLSSRTRLLEGMTSFLLTGVTLGMISTALISVIRFLVSPLTARSMDLWLVGGLDIMGWSDMAPCLPLLFGGLTLLFVHLGDLRQMELGEEIALGRGVSIQSVRRMIFLGGSLATASIVAVVGPVGFVGLLVPHLIRRIYGSDLRLVFPCSLFGGGILLVLADLLARSLSLGGRGAELPVGILTNLGGGILFLFLLFRAKNRMISRIAS